MKKITKSILSILLALILVQTSFVCAFANGTSQNDCQKVDVHKIDGDISLLKKVTGLPKDNYIYEDGKFGEQYYIIGDDNDLQEQFIAYSENCVDFTTVYFKDLNVIPWDKFAIHIRGNALIINGTFELSMYCDNETGYTELYLQTNDFNSWTVSEKSILYVPNYEHHELDYVGKYNGYYIAADVWNESFWDNGKVGQKYYVSTDGTNWQEKYTPLIATETLEGYSSMCVEGYFKIIVTNGGVLFYFNSYNITDGANTTTSFGEYIMTKDFNTYQTIDLSALGGCNGKLLGEDANNWYYYYDSLGYCSSTTAERFPIFTRWQGKMSQSKDTYMTDIDSKLNMYVLNTDTMKFEPYFEQDDCEQFTTGIIAKNKAAITIENSNGESFIFKKSGNSFEKYEWEDLNSRTINYRWHFDDVEKLDSVEIVGLKDSNTLFITADYFDTVYEFDISNLGMDVEYKTSSTEGIFVSVCEDVDNKYIETRYYISYDELVEYAHEKDGCIFGEWCISQSADSTGKGKEVRTCCYCGKTDERTIEINNGWVLENGKWAYYENNQKVANKWIKDSHGWCYLDFDGYMATNKWVADSKGVCYVGSNGYCVTNSWIKDDSGLWCYLDNNGRRTVNKWVKDSHGWCYLDSNGRMATNKWIKDSVGWCYVGADGYCVTNKWVKDSHGWCYLDSNGRMATNKWIKDSVGWCYVGADGYCVTNAWKADSKGWCYLDANGRMMTNSWLQWNGNWYYLDGNGYMVTGTKVIDGKTYKFASNGVWIG